MSDAPESRYRFARQPKWVISHVLVAALIITMVNLGLWQFRKWDHRKASNRQVTTRMNQPTVPVGQLDLSRADSQYRRVSLTGTYVAGQEVLVRGRSKDESPGSWVLSPLRVKGTEEVVVINRGWIANDGRYTALPSFAKAPSTEVSVTGLVQASQTRGTFGATDPPTGTLTNLARADIARLQKQVPEKLQPAYVQLESQTPTPSQSAPKILDDPPLDEGPYFSYTVQWFIFSTIALVGYPFILRRTAREKERERRPASPAPDTERAAARTD